MSREPMRVGIIGCGAISGAYLTHAKRFSNFKITACADLVEAAARNKASEFGIARILPPEQLLHDNDIDLVLNLTIPKVHGDIALAALEAGKHVYNEKPLCIEVEQGKRIARAAKQRQRRVGCAPDTFLGSGLQTSRKAIDDGLIGRPVGFTAFMLCAGHESWHPSPEFFYQPGAGPMLDMGPYYVNALLNCLGPVRTITGAASIAIPQRTITSEPKRGQTITVTTPDHVAGTMTFANGAAGVIMTSFATNSATVDGRQPITIYGDQGTLRVPDPNGFDGPVHVRRNEDAEWRQLEPASQTGLGRAVGVADMVDAILHDRPHRASLEQALLTLEVMQGFVQSSETGRAITPETIYERPAPLNRDERFLT